MDAINALPPAGLAWVVFVVLLAGFVHGVIGFGFPLVAMPLLAMVVDYKAGIVFALVPILFLNIAGATVGVGLGANIARFWYMPIVMVAGVYFGTQTLIHVNATPFLLLLIAAILLFLNIERLGARDWFGVKRHPVASAIVASLIAGLFEATVNVAVPPLLIFFLLIGLAPSAIVQAMNLCFIGGKVMQIGVWWVEGGLDGHFWLRTVPWGLAAVAMFLVGSRIRNRIPPTTYILWLRRFLWLMCGVLSVQFMIAISK